MHVVFVTTEVAPWSKVGGLADVLAALPIALAAQGLAVTTISPRYAEYEGISATDIYVPLNLPPTLIATLTKEDTAATQQQTSPASSSVSDTTESLLPGEEGGSLLTTESTNSITHARLYRSTLDGVDRVFVDHPFLRLKDIYGAAPPIIKPGGGTSSSSSASHTTSLTYQEGGDTSDLDLRYNVLCQAALAAPVLLEHQNQQQEEYTINSGTSHVPIVFIANDWPTALISVRLRHLIQPYLTSTRAPACVQLGEDNDQNTTQPLVRSNLELLQSELEELDEVLRRRLANAVTAFCIHNMAYQGVFSAATFERLRLPQAALPPLLTSFDWKAVLNTQSVISNNDDDSIEASEAGNTELLEQQPEASNETVSVDVEGSLNFMRGALLTSDALITVSPGYAQELTEDERMACGMRDIIAARGIRGIMNGIDTIEWDPAKDLLLPVEARYTAAGAPSGKAYMKSLLQQRLGLRVDPDVPLFAFIGRLTQQKGVDVILAASPALLASSPPPAPAPFASSSPSAPVLSPTSLETRDSLSSLDCPPPSPPSSPTRGRSRGGNRSSGKRPSSKYAGNGGGGGISCNSGSLTSVSSHLPSSSVSRGLIRPITVSNAILPDHQSTHNNNNNNNNKSKTSIKSTDLQLVLLGTGEPWMEAALTGLQHSFPGQAAGLPQFSEELAHWILAAADFVLVPSRFEPCGLIAQCGVRYGAVPIVTSVGGLHDLVTSEVGYCIPALSDGGASGLERQDVQMFVSAVRVAATEWGSVRYQSMQRRGMEMDLSWKDSAEEWRKVLEEVVRKKEEERKGGKWGK